MKIVLLVDSKGLGKRGTLIEVSDGYALNLLIPQGRAVDAESERGKQEMIRQEKKQEGAKERKEEQGEALKNLPTNISISLPANENGVLFTSVNKESLTKHLKEQGYTADTRWFNFAPIKDIGVHTVEAVCNDIKKTITITITNTEA